MTKACLIVENIVVAYDAATVLRSVSLSADYGEIVAIRGANGSGKSTLLRAIAGAIPMTAGDIRIGGRSVRAKSVDLIARRFGVAYLRQERRGIPDLTVMSNLTLAAWRSRSYRTAVRVASTLLDRDDFARLRTNQDATASSLSGGQRLLLALAIIEMTGASLLLLDEPFAGADTATQSLVSDTVRRWASDGHCVLIVEHGEFENHATREIMIHHGHVEAENE